MKRQLKKLLRKFLRICHRPRWREPGGGDAEQLAPSPKQLRMKATTKEPNVIVPVPEGRVVHEVSKSDDLIEHCLDLLNF